MSTDRQKSFIATLGTHNSQLHFLDTLLGEKAFVTSTMVSGGFFSGRRQKHEVSHLLGLRHEATTNAERPLTLYFRHSRTGYTLYIRTKGRHYGKCLHVNKEGLIGAFAEPESTSFILLNDNCERVNLDHIKTDVPSLYLQARDSGLVHSHKTHDSDYTFIADKGGIPLPLTLNILERNAPYLNHPDEA